MNEWTRLGNIMLTCPCNVDPLSTDLYSKIWVYNLVYIFFALKHILLVLVRTAVLTRTHNLCFELK